MYGLFIRVLFVSHLATTFYMLGLIWIMQVVHYPLFASVGNEQFSDYARRHSKRITLVVASPMLIEAATALLLLLFRPSTIAVWSLWTGVALLGCICLSTAMVQVPCHKILSWGFDPAVHHRLVWTNGLRTAAWSLRGALVLWMVWSSLSPLGTAHVME